MTNNIEDKDRIEISYTTHTVKNFIYKEVELYPDEDGVLCKKSLGSGVVVSDIKLLQAVHRCSGGDIVDIKPITEVNNWLLYKCLYEDCKDTRRHADALLKYYWFLHDTDVVWDDFPYSINKRPTYRYKKYLKDLYASDDKEISLSRTTANNYMNSVVSFYKHYLNKGYKFQHPPFQHETVKVTTSNSHTNISKSKTHIVASTDLRLKLPKSQKPDIKRELKALSKAQWTALNDLLSNSRKVIRIEGETRKTVSLPEESSLMFRLMRYTGMRREEVVTFPVNFIRKINHDDRSYIRVRIGPSQGVLTKNSKERTIEIPVFLMKELHDYTTSNRYINRREKLKIRNTNIKIIPLFIQYAGEPYNLKTLNARFSEIRKTLDIMGVQGFDEHKPHNLRATYAVFRLRELRNSGVKGQKLADFIQSRLGHEDIEVTESYLKQSEEPDSHTSYGSVGQSVAEEAIEDMIEE